MLEVYLLKQGAQNAVKVPLPAADHELLDALEKAGITNERDIYSVEVIDMKVLSSLQAVTKQTAQYIPSKYSST